MDKQCWLANTELELHRLRRDVAKLRAALDLSADGNQHSGATEGQPEMLAARKDPAHDHGLRYGHTHGKLYIKQFVLQPRLERMLQRIE